MKHFDLANRWTCVGLACCGGLNLGILATIAGIYWSEATMIVFGILLGLGCLFAARNAMALARWHDYLDTRELGEPRL